MNSVKEWFKKSKRDLKAAKSNFKERFYDIAAFLVHQSLEKALKALYIKKNQKLVKTHNLVDLAVRLNLDKSFVGTCDEINPFYIESRYPPLFVMERYTKKNISRLIKEAEVIIRWTGKRL